MALPDISKLSALSRFWCAFILQGFSLVVFLCLVIFFIVAHCSPPPLFNVLGICIITVVENCSLAKGNHSELLPAELSNLNMA